MTLQEILRSQTQGIRDTLSLVERKYSELSCQRVTAEDSLKRAATEITKHRALEIERKHLVTEAESKVTGIQQKLDEIQQKLDELERQRLELIERLTERRGEIDSARKRLDEARQATEKVQAEVTQARKIGEGAGVQLRNVEEERIGYQTQLRETMIRALDIHLSEFAKRIEQAFSNQEERQKRAAAAAALKKARHEDHRVGDLCDQREQYRQLLAMATVPGVKETIGKALQKIEGELQKLYPDALSSENTVAELGFIEEMHFFADGRGKASIILPIDAEMVERIEKGDTSPAATRSMRLVWDMIKSGLKHTDGEFCFKDGRCLFASLFSAEDMPALDGFGVSMAQSRALQFKFSPLPSELQEALNYEKAND